MSMEEAIDNIQDDWIVQAEAGGVLISDILAGQMWIHRFADSSQLEIVIHQMYLFMHKEKENWTQYKHHYC